MLVDGPWQHRDVSAAGLRFHVAEAGPRDGPLALLLHGFPEFWWSWRAQLVALAAGRLPRGRPRPARLRRDRQAAAGLRRVHAVGGRRRAGARPRRPRRPPGRRGLGRLPGLDAPRRCTPAWCAPSRSSPRRTRCGRTPGCARARSCARRRTSPGFQVPRLPEARLRSGAQVAELMQRWGGPRVPGRRDAGALLAGHGDPGRRALRAGALPLGRPLAGPARGPALPAGARPRRAGPRAAAARRARRVRPARDRRRVGGLRPRRVRPARAPRDRPLPPRGGAGRRHRRPARPHGARDRPPPAGARPRRPRPAGAARRPRRRARTSPSRRCPPRQALALAQALLDEGRAFGAHEVLEASWKAAPPGRAGPLAGPGPAVRGGDPPAARQPASAPRACCAARPGGCPRSRRTASRRGSAAFAAALADRVEAGRAEVPQVRLRG